jgi:hypothetical protein
MAQYLYSRARSMVLVVEIEIKCERHCGSLIFIGYLSRPSLLLKIYRKTGVSKDIDQIEHLECIIKHVRDGGDAISERLRGKFWGFPGGPAGLP